MRHGHGQARDYDVRGPAAPARLWHVPRWCAQTLVRHQRSVSSAGEGRYTVHVMLSRMGDYTVSLALFDGAIDGSLGFEKRVQAVCPLHRYSAIDVGGGCEVCPASTRCGDLDANATRGATLATLDLLPNHWRLSNLSTDIRKCVRDAHTPSSCLGGDGSSYCAEGTRGPLCRTCSEPQHHFVTRTARCAECPEHARAIAATYATVLAGCAALALVAGAAGCCLWRWRGALTAFATRYGLSAKLKIVSATPLLQPHVPRAGNPPTPQPSPPGVPR